MSSHAPADAHTHAPPSGDSNDDDGNDGGGGGRRARRWWRWRVPAAVALLLAAAAAATFAVNTARSPAAAPTVNVAWQRVDMQMLVDLPAEQVTVPALRTVPVTSDFDSAAVVALLHDGADSRREPGPLTVDSALGRSTVVFTPASGDSWPHLRAAYAPADSHDGPPGDPDVARAAARELAGQLYAAVGLEPDVTVGDPVVYQTVRGDGVDEVRATHGTVVRVIPTVGGLEVRGLAGDVMLTADGTLLGFSLPLPAWEPTRGTVTLASGTDVISAVAGGHADPDRSDPSPPRRLEVRSAALVPSPGEDGTVIWWWQMTGFDGRDAAQVWVAADTR